MLSPQPLRKMNVARLSPIRSEGRAAIKNNLQGDWLQFLLGSGRKTTRLVCGLIVRWHGHHHFAIESPTPIMIHWATAAGLQCCGVIAGAPQLGWQLSVRVGP